jgi:hypothetical protein
MTKYEKKILDNVWFGNSMKTRDVILFTLDFLSNVDDFIATFMGINSKFLTR